MTKITSLASGRTCLFGDHQDYLGLPVIACNRHGHESCPSNHTKGIQFWGNSFITGPQGEIVAHASHNEDEIVYG